MSSEKILRHIFFWFLRDSPKGKLAVAVTYLIIYLLLISLLLVSLFLLSVANAS